MKHSIKFLGSKWKTASLTATAKRASITSNIGHYDCIVFGGDLNFLHVCSFLLTLHPTSQVVHSHYMDSSPNKYLTHSEK